MQFLPVLLTIHIIACIALVFTVMLQRSEGGALGMSGGGTGGVISGRGAAGVLVKTTMVLAGIFFTTSIVMTRMNNDASKAPSALEQLQQQTPANPFDPASGLPATTAPPASTTTPTTAPSTTIPAAPAPAPAIDPLAPRAATPAPATTTPAATPPAASPATTTPTAPAPTPENGGSNN